MKTVPGMSRKEMQRLVFPSLKNKQVVYNGSTNSNMTQNRSYTVINHFIYLNRKYDLKENLQWWDFDQFITLKNDYGWTVKMNVLWFTPLSEVQARSNAIKDHYSDPLNVLWEAHQMQEPVS